MELEKLSREIKVIFGSSMIRTQADSLTALTLALALVIKERDYQQKPIAQDAYVTEDTSYEKIK